MKRTLTDEKEPGRVNGSVGKVLKNNIRQIDYDSKYTTIAEQKNETNQIKEQNSQEKLTNQRLDKLRKIHLGDLGPHEVVGLSQSARSGGGRSTSSQIEQGVRMGIAKKLFEDQNSGIKLQRFDFLGKSIDRQAMSEVNVSRSTKNDRSKSLHNPFKPVTGNGLLANQGLKPLREEPERKNDKADTPSIPPTVMSTIDHRDQCMSHVDPFKDRVLAAVGGGLNKDNCCKNHRYAKLKSKIPLCKNHFMQFMRSILAKGFHNIYRHPDVAYSSMDMTGLGWVEPMAFANSIGSQRVISSFNHSAYRCKISCEDVYQYALASNIFVPLLDKITGKPNGKVGLRPSNFKKIFFPQLCHGDQGGDALDNLMASNVQATSVEPREQGQKPISKQDRQKTKTLDRITQLEKALRDKFGQKFDSVKKAFLFMDADHDGYITIEDFLRNFSDIEVSYDDLSKLMRERDSQHVGKLNYMDFSAWVGNCIHVSEGFFFRHDSVRNPQYERNLEKQQKRGEETDRAKRQLNTQELKQNVIMKIRQQWTSILKAFKDMNKDTNAEGISPPELKFYLNHWGFKVPETQFRDIYKFFDVDGDGKISYQDFNLAVGHEIHPGETPYFRQDTLKEETGAAREGCKHPLCWQETIGSGNFCTIHTKMHMDEVKNFYQKIYLEVGNQKWNTFKEKLHKYACGPDDNYQSIEYDKFEAIFYRILGLRLTLAQHEMLFTTNGRVAPNGIKYINVQQVYAAKQMDKLRKVYDKLQLNDNTEDDAQDAAGYTGDFQRKDLRKVALKPLSESVLFKLLAANMQKMNELMRTIFSIDKTRNGYVTSTEIDDIIRLIFNAKQMKQLSSTSGLHSLDDYDLRPFYKQFASSANRVLIDYKQFRDYLMQGIENVRENKSRNTDLKNKASTQDSVNLRMHQLKRKLKNDSASPMIKLKRSSDLIQFNQQNKFQDIDMASRVPSERNSDARSYSLHPRSINMKNQLSAALGSRVVPGRLNEIESRGKNHLPQVASSRYLNHKALPKGRDFVEMDKAFQNGSRKQHSQAGSFYPRQSMLEKSQSEAMLRPDQTDPSFNHKLSIANLRAQNNFSSTLTKPNSIYKAQQRLFDPSLSSKKMSRRLDHPSQLGETRSVSPFEVQPGQARFTKNLVNSINVENDGASEMQGLKDLTNDIYNDETTSVRQKYINSLQQHNKQRSSTIDDDFMRREYDIEGIEDEDLLMSIRKDSMFDKQIGRNELLQSINELPKSHELSVNQHQSRPKTMQRSNFGSRACQLYYSENQSDNEDIVNEYYGGRTKIPTSMPSRAAQLAQNQENNNFVSKQSTNKLALNNTSNGKFVTDLTAASQMTRASRQSTIEQSMKDKLSYDWKNIYRKLHANDLNGTGKVSMAQFERTLKQTSTFLSREDISLIKSQYGVRGRSIEKQLSGFDQNTASVYGSRSGSPGLFDAAKKLKMGAALIDYDELSANILGSQEKHHEKFDVMRKTHSKLNQIKMKLQFDESKLNNEYILQGQNGSLENSHYMSMTGKLGGGGQFRTPIKLTTNQQMEVLAKRAAHPKEKFQQATLKHEPRDSSLTKNQSANVFKRPVDLADGRIGSTIKKNQSYLKINVKNEK